jgi:hypothetical protein
MQLDDIREKYTIKEISYLSNISEDNLEKIFAKDFESLRKLKTLGFISILAREYKIDLSDLEAEARQYYAQFTPERKKNLGITRPISLDKKEKSSIFPMVIFALLAYATWYFLTQFDKKHLSELMPFIDEATIEKFVSSEDNDSKVESVLIIGNTNEDKIVESIKEEPKVEVKEEVVETAKAETSTTVQKKVLNADETVLIIPHKRLWFGLIDTATKKRDHFSVADIHKLDVSNTVWLVATSSASFSLKSQGETEAFTDNKEHYFSMDKDGIKSLSKDEYVTLGGWEQW